MRLPSKSNRPSLTASFRVRMVFVKSSKGVPFLDGTRLVSTFVRRFGAETYRCTKVERRKSSIYIDNIRSVGGCNDIIAFHGNTFIRGDGGRGEWRSK